MAGIALFALKCLPFLPFRKAKQKHIGLAENSKYTLFLATARVLIELPGMLSSGHYSFVAVSPYRLHLKVRHTQRNGDPNFLCLVA